MLQCTSGITDSPEKAPQHPETALPVHKGQRDTHVSGTSREDQDSYSGAGAAVHIWNDRLL